MKRKKRKGKEKRLKGKEIWLGVEFNKIKTKIKWKKEVKGVKKPKLKTKRLGKEKKRHLLHLVEGYTARVVLVIQLEGPSGGRITEQA